MYKILIIAIISLSFNIPANATLTCSDNPGTCLSSPFCLGKTEGTACRKKGTCTKLSRKDMPLLTPCCSCKNTIRKERFNFDKYNERVIPNHPNLDPNFNRFDRPESPVFPKHPTRRREH